MVARGTNVTEDKQKTPHTPDQTPQPPPWVWAWRPPAGQTPHGVFTLAWSGAGTGTGTGTGIMHNLSHCTWTGKNGLYGFNKNLSDCT